MRAFDWSDTPVGPVETWPQSLKTAVSILLESKFPMYIAWGKEYIQFYNDGYRPILGATKHPIALGHAAKGTFPESWGIIGPMFEDVGRGVATGSVDWQLPLDRNGYLEECYFTFSYSPIRDESDHVGGVLVTVTETTARVLGERRLETLRSLADLAAHAKQESEAWTRAADICRSNPADVAFALFYRADAEGSFALEAGCGFDHSIHSQDARWPLRQLLCDREPLLLADLAERLGTVVGAKWPEPVTAALLMRIDKPGLANPYGILIAGLSPRRELDAQYRSFLTLVADHVATAIGNVRRHQEERRRLESLAELDRAKTTFFSNVSHEFRTPLTLLLGPLEELLSEPGAHAEELRLIQRNALRLQQLVDTLLDFSRIEAGRGRASQQATDLSMFTVEIASTYRSAMEKAGIRLNVVCPPLPALVYVDREMWEKVVLNLLSNAYKYTFEGIVTVTMRADDGQAVLSVEDTGTGIPENELKHIFERFHRVEGVRGRVLGGTGIGLALVAELIKLHGGQVGVQSTLGKGSTFTVSLPMGVPPASEAGASNGGVPRSTISPSASLWAAESPNEALEPAVVQIVSQREAPARVLVADDNADMRVYVSRLLARKYQVEAVADGSLALASALDHPPDLVLSDVMMPGLDGFRLLEAMRADSRTADVPVILLSARAGEEAHVEGLEAGANDYLVKPFSARELMARVNARLELSKTRKRAAEREAALRAEAEAARDEAVRVIESITDGFFTLDHYWRFTYINGAAETLLGAKREELLGKNHWELFPAMLGTFGEREYFRAVREGVSVEFEIFYPPWDLWFSVKAYPIAHSGLSVYFHDITDRKAAEEAVRESEERFRSLADNIPNLAWMAHADGEVFWYNQRWSDYTGKSPEEMFGWGWQSVHDPHVLPRVLIKWRESLESGQSFEMEFPLRRRDGEFRWFLTLVRPIRNEKGEIVRWFGTNTDIDDKRRAEEALRESEELARSVIEGSPDGVEILNAAGHPILLNEQAMRFRRVVNPDEGNAQQWTESWGQEHTTEAARAFAGVKTGMPTHFEIAPRELSLASVRLRITLAPLMDTAGQVTRVLSIIRDVTAERRAEEELRQTAKLEGLGVMAGGIAHDFNNLLTGILGNASLLNESLTGERQGFAADIVLAAERAADLTRQMLAFAGKGRFQVVKTNLSRLVRDISRLSRPAIDRNVDIHLDLKNDCIVEGDPGQLQQVVMNLMINAGEAIDAGKAGLVTVRTGEVDVDRVYLSHTFGRDEGPEGKYVFLEVSDNGKGMDERTKGRIFDPFFTTKFTGRGLGLAAVSGIVRSHNGFIRVYSVPGEGTSIKVLFPASGPVHEAPGGGQGAPIQAHGVVLLVDDEQIVRRLGESVLKRCGYEVLLASDGKEALDIFRLHHSRIDLVVLDMMMPVMGGEEALRAIRAVDDAVPVIVCSGYNEVEVIRRFTDQAVGAFLQKPYSIARLIEIVTAVLKRTANA